MNRALLQWHTCRLPLLAALLLFCDNPFFPATGDPPVTSSQRSTPQGVLRQLINAYGAQRIDLYMDLFSPTHDFRFYVTPYLTEEEYRARFGPRPCEPVDSMCLYVKNNINDTCFYYWNYDEEIQGAQNMFQKATQITFVESPTYSNHIRYITNGKNETTNVEIVMQGGRIEVTGEIYYDSLGQRSAYLWPIDIYEQVFYLERDPESPNLWVIQKWFDLGTATGN